jgi:hypothetical protein
MEHTGVYRVMGGKHEGKNHLEYLGVDGSSIQKLVLNKLEVVDWIHLAQDRDKWRTVVNTVMNLQVA